ncbi:CDP-diacylglycerol--glycerol-3-phosphate 3-phosphatidyltransferase [Phorcysia thermohydrogeniphila]|uniref:CDP-diacylglycerol--glycerol-3-phosphate 3-phosphatidyltransferase n=1 Tax=Phorcysia thermohydrogeniphila TaxID=936138 RepID=A0A4R1GHV2_9BACT|nr:CDP-diacylglycerol--glycerol-3-phosphate 3-phosphatidyltransferase [Phorcysia thermohydrogeniphila]TCK06663.1 cardiolipin synthase [Phorcysia thermohydrogeniphila]
MVNLPNLITLFRAFLVPVFIMAVFYRNFKLALAVFLVASVSDALDGFLARRLNQVTTLGVILDPIADKALINSGFILLSYVDRIIPVWLTVLVISRDILILVGGWLLTAFGKINKIRPTLVGKLTAFSQFFTIFLTLLNLNFKVCLSSCIMTAYAITACLTVISAVSYSARGIRELNSEKISQ